MSNTILDKIIKNRQAIQNLPPITSYKQTLHYDSIQKFYTCSPKNKNDNDNKIRECIIDAILNNKVPQDYYEYSPTWKNIRKLLLEFINKIYKSKINSISCISKGGRKYNYDFEFNINNNQIYKLEFKHNATKIDDCPQFSSPTHPSKFLDRNFEEFYYDNSLGQISDFAGLPKPDRNIYLKTIHSYDVECMKDYKEKFDSDPAFKKFCGKIDEEAISKFINDSNLNIEALSEYLIDSQKNKIYMCYKDGCFYQDTMDESNFIIDSVIKKTKRCFICKTQNGRKLEVRLRFKNGLGLQFPAFQIKRLVLTKKDLQKLCEDNSIEFKKKDTKLILSQYLNNKGINF